MSTRDCQDCRLHPRRTFLADTGMGFTGLALGAMLQRDGIVRGATTMASVRPAAPDGGPHFQPRAKSVIWLFMAGGVSQMESFDPKPEINKYDGKTFKDTPHEDFLKSPLIKSTVRTLGKSGISFPPKIMGMQVGYKQYGQSGVAVSDWFPHLGSCVDELAIIRSMWTSDQNHIGQLLMHNGKHRLDGLAPSLGAWVHYGLGALTDNLPQYVVLGRPLNQVFGGSKAHRADYLGAAHSGVPLKVDPDDPLPFASPGSEYYLEEHQRKFDLLGELNRMNDVEYPDDAALRARIRSYELAFRMQFAVPEVMRLRDETRETLDLYGVDTKKTKEFGRQCLVARRLVERGVRFVQIYHGTPGGGGSWDSHTNVKKSHSRVAKQVDQPVAALIKDLKRRGLLDETLVVWTTEFGRTVGRSNDGAGQGRDHSPFGFCVWMAGGGIKPGVIHGATDELGMFAVEKRQYVTDLHATVLHQLGIDPRRLDIPGRKRIEVDYGHPIKEILA